MKTIAQQLGIKEFPFFIRDEYENELYFENLEGYWEKKEYDSNGNEIYYENSDEYWWKKEYDSNGNEIYFEDSDEEIIDNRPKGCEGKIVEIDGKKYKLTEV